MADMRSDTSRSANVNNPDNQLHFRCSDVSGQKCDWQTSGRNEDEVMRNVEQHGRDQHNMEWTDDIKNKVRGAIRGWRAA